jgi:hypothetical protein
MGLASLAANPVPFVSQPLVPVSVAPGSGAFILTVNGTAFVPGSVVKWNGRALPTTFVSQSRLTAQVSASLVAQPGTASVTASSPSPGGGASNVAFLPIASPVGNIQFGADAGVGKGLFVGHVIAGDFNNDGKIDLAATFGNLDTYFKKSGIDILLGNGDGTFQHVEGRETAAFPQPAIGDFNGDGIPDLVAVGSFPFSLPIKLDVLLGNGDGTFQHAREYTVGISPMCGCGVPVVADFNRDGKLDLAFSTQQGLAVFLGNGDGTFGSPIVNFISGMPSIGDFNGDGKLDLALAVADSNGVSVALGNGDGTFQNPSTIPISGVVDVVTVADFNGDGILDLATSSETGVTVILGMGDGTFGKQIVSPDLPNSTDSVAVADFNADGILDLLVAHNKSSHISYMLGNGDGSFTLAKVLNRPLVTSLISADLNGDGRVDFGFVLNSGGSFGRSSVNIDLQTAP